MMWHIGLALLVVVGVAFAEEESPYDVVELYTQDQLIQLIEKNQHLAQVKRDECQLVQDIEAHAVKVQEPSYQYLWGDMLLQGVCVDKKPEQGWYYLMGAAQQGFPPALTAVASSYRDGRLVQKDGRKAVIFMREGARLGYVPAQIGYVELLLKGFGSPYDYEEAYRWLHHAVIADSATHEKARRLLASLGQKMPQGVVDNAKKSPPHPL